MRSPAPIPERPLRVGDRVRCLCADAHLAGRVLVVIGLGVLSCGGFRGAAVRYSARGYSVLRPGEWERVK